MRGLVATALLLTGCDRVFATLKVHDLADGGGVDVAADVPADVPPDSDCAGAKYGMYGASGAGLFQLCLTDMPQPSYSLPAALDTGISAMCTYTIAQSVNNSDPVCVIVAANITVGTNSRVVGASPLVLLATNTLTVSGSIDIGSVRGGAANGAGANDPSCQTTALKGESGDATHYGGGGAGGTFQTSGGVGGNGTNGAIGGGKLSGAGNALSYVRGGCRGGNGGNSTAGTGGGGGASGGAVYLIAGAFVDILSTARVNASGEGGAGGAQGMSDGLAGGGGGGGGSGGLIGIDAPLIRLGSNARLVANGGGGGGSGPTGGTSALDGKPGSSASPATPFPFAAAGGLTDAPGGDGANAMMLNAQSGTSGDATQGGGGGGGGLGYIKIYTPQILDSGAIYSPAPT